MAGLLGLRGMVITAGVLAATAVAAAQPQQVRNVVYKCPGNPVLYTDAISDKEAKERGCRTIEGAPITVIQSGRARSSAPVPPVTSTTARLEPYTRVDPNEQRARDSDRRAILSAELRRDEQALADLQREYNNGEPERRGDERNYQKYLDRLAELKASIVRKESDVAAIRRELSKVPAAQ